MLVSSSTPCSGAASSVTARTTAGGPGVAGPARMRGAAALGVARAARRRAGAARPARAGSAISITSRSGAERADSRSASVLRHGRRQRCAGCRGRAPARDRLCSRAYADERRRPTSAPASIAVSAPSSCGQLEHAQDALARARRQALQRRRLDVDRMPGARRAAPPGAPRCAPASRARSSGPTQQQQRLARLPHRRPIAAVAAGSLQHLVVDAVGGAAQRQLAQRDQVALAEEVRAPRARPAAAGRPCLPSAAAAARRAAGRRSRPRRPRRTRGRAPSPSTRMPVMPLTTSFRLSRCCTFIVDQTSMPASSSSSTSCQRLGWREPGDVGVRQLVDQDQPPACARARRRDRTPSACGRGRRTSLQRQRAPGRPSSAAVSARPWVSTTPITTSTPGRASRCAALQHRVGLADAGRGAEEDLQLAAPRLRLLLAAGARAARRDRGGVGHGSIAASQPAGAPEAPVQRRRRRWRSGPAPPGSRTPASARACARSSCPRCRRRRWPPRRCRPRRPAAWWSRTPRSSPSTG